MSFNNTKNQTIVDEWNSVKVPPTPKIESVMLDAKNSAILVLDILQQNCTINCRPRCAASVPGIMHLIKKGRDKSVVIVYSVFPSALSSDILSEVAPLASDLVVTSGPDKFLGTVLENFLKDKLIKSVVIVGSAANGAVLHTASSAVFRGFKVIVPIDGMSAGLTPKKWTLS